MIDPKNLGGRLRKAVLTSLHRRLTVIQPVTPLVSFTFDDFPRSALRIAGRILRRYEARGTYYASPGLSRKVNEQGEHFEIDDLHSLLAEGHELGSHTYGHISCRSVTTDFYLADVIKANSYLREVTGMNSPVSFAYPFGHVTLSVKRGIAGLLSSCRSTFGGLNHRRIDLNLLRANKLYSASTDLEVARELIRKNKELRGWLIFYTHDVCDNPSPYGCTPQFFEQIVKLAAESGARILTVGAALEKATGVKAAFTSVGAPQSVKSELVRP